MLMSGVRVKVRVGLILLKKTLSSFECYNMTWLHHVLENIQEIGRY
jgi:hypothetical protein